MEIQEMIARLKDATHFDHRDHKTEHDRLEAVFSAFAEKVNAGQSPEAALKESFASTRPLLRNCYEPCCLEALKVA